MPRAFWLDAIESKQETTLVSLEAVIWMAWEEGDAPAVNAAMNLVLKDWGTGVHRLLSDRLKDAGWTWRADRWTPAADDNLRLVEPIRTAA